jgi:hypothetical protein
VLGAILVAAVNLGRRILGKDSAAEH